jgi:prevent-host-death family protein
MKEISSADARSQFADLVAQAYYQKQQFVITRSNKPMCVLLSIDEYSHLTNDSSYTDDQPSQTLSVSTSIDTILSDTVPKKDSSLSQTIDTISEAVHNILKPKNKKS